MSASALLVVGAALTYRVWLEADLAWRYAEQAPDSATLHLRRAASMSWSWQEAHSAADRLAARQAQTPYQQRSVRAFRSERRGFAQAAALAGSLSFAVWVASVLLAIRQWPHRRAFAWVLIAVLAFSGFLVGMASASWYV